MSDIRDRIIQNIHSEAKSHIENGTQMSKRDPQWDHIVTEAINIAQSLYAPVIKRGRNKLTPEQRLKRRQQKMAKKNGISYDEWMKICKSHYSIDDVNFIVTSLAHGPNHLKTWKYSSEYECQEQVYKLMSWMHYNHHEREGCETIEFRYNPLEKKDE